MKNPDPGYRLPPGDLTTPEYECLILFYPKEDEYRRALWGSLDYLATWHAWERDEQKRGKDAAQAWKEANDITWSCYTMNTCEQILDLLGQIEANTRVCCGESNYVSYQENTVVTTVIVPNVGTAPTTYGETAVTGWDEWLEYVCYHAHDYVDDLIETAEKLHTILQIGGYTLDFIAHLFSLVQWRMVEELIPVNFSQIAAIVDALGQAGIQNEFSDLAADFETYREDIVCSLILGTSLEDAVKAVVGEANVLWTLYYSHLDYETTQAVIYEGGVDGVGYLTPVKRQDCDCSLPPFDAEIFAVAADLTGTSVSNQYTQLITLWNNNPWIVYQTSKNLNPDYLINPITIAAGQSGAGFDDGTFNIDTIQTWSDTQWREQNNRFEFVADRNSAQQKTFDLTISNIRVWVSEDGGATGQWYNADITVYSAHSSWTVDTEAGTLHHYASGTGTYEHRCIVDLLAQP